MSQIDVLYTPVDAPVSGSEPDAALLQRFRGIVGDEMAAGWRVAASAHLTESPGTWRVTLENDASDSSIEVPELLMTAADPHLHLDHDIALPGFEMPEPARQAPLEPVSFTLPLPVDIPAILFGSEAAQRKRAAAQGVLGGLIVSAILGLLTPTGSAIRHMFDPRTPTAAVPTSILCLFFWGITYGLNRRRRLEAIDKLNGDDLLPAVVSGLETLGVKRIEEALRGQGDQYSVVRFSPLLRRIWITLEQWLIRPSLQNAHLVIEQQVISDREATQRAYNLLRIFVWATPVLGLIGTVVGISIAVGGFASFLSTNVDDISKIKEGLVGVTGLSFAFLITLEGLLSSLILMLFTSSIQTREERLYAQIERDVAEQFLPELQRISPEREPGSIAPGTEAWAEAMSEAARKVIRAVETAGKRIVAKWDEKHDLHVAALTDLARVTGNVLESQAVLQTAMTQMRESGLANVLENLDASLRDLKPLLTNLSQPFVLQAVPTPNQSRVGQDGILSGRANLDE